MENRELIIICAVILIAACIIAAGIYFGLSNNNTNIRNNSVNDSMVNNTTNITNNTVDSLADNSDKGLVYSPQKGEYVDPSGQYEKDSRGNTVHTYQGSDGVIYEEYYDGDGNPISSEEYYI